MGTFGADEPSLHSHRACGSPTALFSAAAETVSSAVDIGIFGTGAYYLPADFNGNTISFQGSQAADGTFAAIYDNGGTAVSLTAAGAPAWYEMPPEVMAFRFIKFVTDTGTAAAATVQLSLKS